MKLNCGSISNYYGELAEIKLSSIKEYFGQNSIDM